MTEPPDQWLSLPEAASVLGIAENAVRSRIKRRTIRARKDNHGRLMVCLPATGGRTRTLVRSRSDPGSNQAAVPSSIPHQSAQDAPETILAAYKESLEALQQAHSAALVALQEELVQARADHGHQVEQLLFNHARNLEDRGRLHRTALAEMRRQIDRLTDALANAAIGSTTRMEPEALPRPRWMAWLPDWFGDQKRSRLKG